MEKLTIHFRRAHQWVAHFQPGKPGEIAIGRPKLRHTVMQANGRDPGIMDGAPNNLSGYGKFFEPVDSDRSLLEPPPRKRRETQAATHRRGRSSALLSLFRVSPDGPMPTSVPLQSVPVMSPPASATPASTGAPGRRQFPPSFSYGKPYHILRQPVNLADNE